MWRGDAIHITLREKKHANLRWPFNELRAYAFIESEDHVRVCLKFLALIPVYVELHVVFLALLPKSRPSSPAYIIYPSLVHPAEEINEKSVVKGMPE